MFPEGETILVGRRVGVRAEVGLRGELLRRWEAPLLVHQVGKLVLWADFRSTGHR